MSVSIFCRVPQAANISFSLILVSLKDVLCISSTTGYLDLWSTINRLLCPSGYGPPKSKLTIFLLLLGITVSFIGSGCGSLDTTLHS